MAKILDLDDLILSQDFNYSIRRVAVNPSKLPKPCYRFTGAGDRPCDMTHTPLSYGLWPFSQPTRLDAMLMYWSWSKIDVKNKIVYIDDEPKQFNFPDKSWVEVARYAERTSYVGSDGGGYGIWYWTTPGSNLSVNIGRAVRFEDKSKAIAWASRNAPRNSSLACLGFSEHESCGNHDDTMFCAAARERGYNSMLVKRKRIKFGHYSGRLSDVVELILCPHQEPPEQTTCCPIMVALRLGDGRGACTCNASGELSNCMQTGFNGAVTMADDYGNRPVDIVSIWAVLFLVLPILALVLIFGFVGLMRSKEPSKESNNESNEASLPLLTIPSSLTES